MLQHGMYATPRSIAERIENRCSSKYLFVTALFTIAKLWKQYKYPPKKEQINKVCYENTMEDYAAIKRREAVIHASTLMNLENVLNERRGTQ